MSDIQPTNLYLNILEYRKILISDYYFIMEAQHYVSETVMIKRRVKTCQVSLMRKNYKDHLIKRHPRENPQDLSPHVSALPSRQAENLEETGQEGEGQAERQDGDIGLQVDAHEHLAPVDQSVG